MARRPALTRDGIVDAAARVADHGGLAAVSMRNVGRELGVEAMSLYHHVPNKESLLDALADWVFVGIELPDPAADWRPAMVSHAESARARLFAHPWSLALVESRRNPGLALVRHHEAVLACLRGNGFSLALASHAFSALDSYVYGFVLTELNLPFEPGEDLDAFAGELQASLPLDELPNLAEILTEQVVGRDYSYGDEFGFGLDLILDSLERHLAD